MALINTPPTHGTHVREPLARRSRTARFGGKKKSRARWVVEMVKHQSIHVVDVEGNTNQDVETDSGNELSQGGGGGGLRGF